VSGRAIVVGTAVIVVEVRGVLKVLAESHLTAQKKYFWDAPKAHWSIIALLRSSISAAAMKDIYHLVLIIIGVYPPPDTPAQPAGRKRRFASILGQN
jgi:ABC-type uncharacterized transport system YnjBCD permease subunit